MVLGLFTSQDAGGVVGVEDGDGFIAIQEASYVSEVRVFSQPYHAIQSVIQEEDAWRQKGMKIPKVDPDSPTKSEQQRVMVLPTKHFLLCDTSKSSESAQPA
ncbi:hypothetical protein NQZ68_035601 [Dissostichus eleginoides]|nr:hypothetical protein NQZ68_035601 [Dissostichus eleginoides]